LDSLGRVFKSRRAKRYRGKLTLILQLCVVLLSFISQRFRRRLREWPAGLYSSLQRLGAARWQNRATG
jgi:hypothetical protein